jgi:hypothetical protein
VVVKLDNIIITCAVKSPVLKSIIIAPIFRTKSEDSTNDKDENDIHTDLEEHKDMPLETRPEEPQQMTESESHETEAQLQEGQN